MSVSRRDFLAAGATAAAGVALGNPLLGESPGVTHRVSGTASSAGVAARPVVIASDNGIRGVKKAYDMIVAGADTLDAIIAGVNIQELDPDDRIYVGAWTRLVVRKSTPEEQAGQA